MGMTYLQRIQIKKLKIIKEVKGKKTPSDPEELIQQYSNSDCVLALGCTNIQKLVKILPCENM